MYLKSYALKQFCKTKIEQLLKLRDYINEINEEKIYF